MATTINCDSKLTRAQELYRIALSDPDWDPAVVRQTTGWSDEDMSSAVKLLAEFGLATRLNGIPSGWAARSPVMAMSDLISATTHDLEAAMNLGLGRLSSLSHVLAGFLAMHEPGRDIELVPGREQVIAVLAEAAKGTSDMVSMHPPMINGVRPAQPANLEWLAAGRSMRTLHMAASLQTPSARQHFQELTDAGAQVRFALSLPLRMIILDHVLAVLPFEHPVPGDDRSDGPAAMIVRNPYLIEILRRFWEHYWHSADEILPQTTASSTLSERERQIVRLLVRGLTDEGIGRAIGVSERTVRRILSELMSKARAESRVQLGFNIHRLGWLEDELAVP
ncbi:LuxR C-terminal-related transcriptional regulator [Streptomyces sp. NPDC088354]|uniref:helix-turn-helix transcriptional regulator n=1 Tax=Streptomyces sp. NPDC088354 TaxID=3365856 RepID=UPI0037FD5BB2